ncbi:MBL fold metallo-hydrolase [Lysinibacillus sp. 2017]|uniref:AhlS family quorum-quenching N-acyl homoserine lactonase n=1 Tax=unclassified Lysinibacillus TaxID=2636778 RepID=UPI000D528478|nr:MULTISPECIES: N-acyl homoserine lactonase family protein [unclassified Lysinibacillus]AWE07676.1 MBL fold metallo-hydrolase [Lysinibacillus sp. 2017]TGN36838.1 N-acyl homoserine lactonase family protein [Lysinibacillus sp. S2017]
MCKNKKVYVLDTGTMKMDKNYMIAMHNPASIDAPHQPNEFVEFPVYAVLIDHPEGKILFDTGCNPDGMGEEGRWPEGVQKLFPAFQSEECYLINRLEQLSVRPEDIKYVVASHLHLDHAGCLELFTNAEIIVHDSELSNVMKSFAMTRDMGAYIWGDVMAWITKELRWRTIKPHEKEVKLAEGVKIINFGPGHAYGMLGLHIELPGHGNVLLASDALYTKESFGPPVKPPGILYDSVGYNHTVERIRQFVNENDSEIWFGHDADQFKTFKKSTEGYYE